LVLGLVDSRGKVLFRPASDEATDETDEESDVEIEVDDSKLVLVLNEDPSSAVVNAVDRLSELDLEVDVTFDAFGRVSIREVAGIGWGVLSVTSKSSPISSSSSESTPEAPNTAPSLRMSVFC
jgi:hypothetical protein